MAVDLDAALRPLLEIHPCSSANPSQKIESFPLQEQGKNIAKFDVLQGSKLSGRHSRCFEKKEDIADRGLSTGPKRGTEYLFPSGHYLQFLPWDCSYSNKLISNRHFNRAIEGIRKCKKFLVSPFCSLPLKKHEHALVSGIPVDHIF